MRLIKALALCAVPTLLLVSCSSSNTSSETSQQGSNAANTLVSGEINGSGSTFQLAFQQEVAKEFQQKNKGVTVNYGGGGSGKGRQELADQVTDFAGTDSLVKDDENAKFKGGEFLYFPIVVAPITVAFNVKGVDDLQISAPTLAGIFERKITSWDAPELATDNPGKKLPSGPITVVRRSDSSGTTDNFSKFLSVASEGAFTLKPGSTVEWPTDTRGENGNNGVAQAVSSTEGAIGYVDYSDAKASGLSVAAIKNKSGNFVEPSLKGASEAAAGATIKDDLTFSPIWTDGENAYPITAGSWVMVYVNQTNSAKGNLVKAYLEYLLEEGQAKAESVDFAPIPESLQKKALDQIEKIVVP